VIAALGSDQPASPDPAGGPPLLIGSGADS